MLVLWGSNQSAGPAPTGYWIETLTSTVSNADSLQGKNIGVDSSGNSYSIGSYVTTISSFNYYWFVVEKYDANGAIQWQKLLTDSVNQVSILGGAVDSSGNVYVIGQDSSSFNGILFKLNSSGVLQWQKQLGDNTYFNQFIGATLDSSGNIYVGGETDSWSGGNSGDFLIAKYNSSGTLQFQNQIYDPASLGYNDIWTIPIDSSGNYYPVGAVNYVAGFVAKFNSSNVLQWQKSFPPFDVTSVVSFYSSCIDSSGNIYCCGYLINSSNVFSGVITKINSSGAIVWQRYLSDSGGYNVGFQYISIDSSNNLYLCGFSGNPEAFCIVKYNSSGVLQWQRSLSTQYGGAGIGITVDSTGHYYVTGFMSNGIGINSLTFKLPTDGTRTGTYDSYTYAASSLVDSAGDMYVNNTAYPTSSPGLTDATGPLTMTVPTFTSTVTTV